MLSASLNKHFLRSAYLQLYDGPDGTYPELVKHCGTALPSPSVYRSVSSQMYVRMRTDASVSARGFKASYVTGELRTHIHTHAHTHTYIHTYIHMHTSVSARGFKASYVTGELRTHIHTHAHTHTYIHTYIHMHTSVSARGFKASYVTGELRSRTYVLTYTHTHIYMQACRPGDSRPAT